MTSIYGKHLLIDGYVAKSSVLKPDLLCSLFDALVDALDMTYLQRPTAIKVSTDSKKLETDDDDGGWSVICQITTSHIALHSWPLRGAFMMDIFSCKPYDSDRATQIVYEFLGVTDANIQLIERPDPRTSSD